MSVKKLMEEEMFQLDRRWRMSSNEEGDERQTMSSEQEGHGKKNRRRRSKMSFDLNDTRFTSEKPTHRKHKTLSSLDINNMVAELRCQVHCQDVDSLNHDQGSEEPLNQLGEQGSSVVEDKLGEATKVLVSHFIDEKNLTTDEKVQSSRELLDALNVLNLNKEMLLKLLQDPDSQVVKHIHNLQDNRNDRDEKSEQEDKQNSQHQSFFWRKFKGRERNSSKTVEHSQDINRIIVRKHGLPASLDIGNRGQAQKVSSHFSIFKFTRKLKRAIRKELPNAGNVEKAMGRESFGVASPSREHFFFERIPKPSTSSNKEDKVGVRSNDICFTPEQQISNIYSEAKMHLAEIVGDRGDIDVNFLSRQAPKSLGRIISYADYSSSPICSPRKADDVELLTSPIRSPSKEFQAGNKIASQQMQEEMYFDLLTLVDSELIADADKIVGDVKIPKSKVSSRVNPDEGADESSISTGDRTHIQDGEIIPSTDFASEKNLSLDTGPGSCSPSVSNNGHGTLKDCETEGQPKSLNLDFEENEPLSSPLPSPSFCLKSKEVEDQDAMTDKSEKPSPVSVLDLTFNEDNTSFPSSRSLPVTEQLIQPRKIKFEDQIFPYVPCLRMCEEGKNSVFKLVNMVMQASGLTWDDLLEKSSLSNYLLEPSFLDELELIPDHLCYDDPQLLFDLIVEVLEEICRRDFDGIFLSVRHRIGPEFKGKDISAVMWEGVAWHLQSEEQRCTLDQTITRDYAKSGRWMDLRLDTENIGIGMEEAILEELLVDTLLNCFCWNPEEESPVFSVEPVENESKHEFVK